MEILNFFIFTKNNRNGTKIVLGTYIIYYISILINNKQFNFQVFKFNIY